MVWARPAVADEGGVSFWMPGELGSFAAVPSTPGLSVPVVYLHVSGTASAEQQFRIGGNVVAGVGAGADLVFVFPGYAFTSPILGGQLALGVGFGAGRMRVSADAVLTGPAGNTVNAARTDRTWGITDLYPSAQLKWNAGTSNVLAYAMGGLPVGTYEVGDLANLGLNHFSIDAGAGYTFLDPKGGHEASIVAGVTYNFENPDTDYQNGIDSHVDVGVSQFFTKQLFLGVAGYAFVQLTGDDGEGAVLGDFKTRVFAAGPQAGYNFHALGRTWTLTGKANFEFAAKHRAEGWNTWLTLVLPVSAPPAEE